MSFYQISIFLVRCPLYLRFAGTALIVVLVSTSWYFLYYCPTQSSIEYYRVHIPFLKAQKAQYLKRDVLYKKAQNVQQKIMHLSVHQVHQALAEVIECANRHTLSLRSCIPKKMHSRLGYTYAPFECALEGSYENIINFFKELATLSYGLMCDECTMTRADTAHVLCTFMLKFLIKR